MASLDKRALGHTSHFDLFLLGGRGRGGTSFRNIMVMVKVRIRFQLTDYSYGIRDI